MSGWLAVAALYALGVVFAYAADVEAEDSRFVPTDGLDRALWCVAWPVTAAIILGMELAARIAVWRGK